MIKKTDIGFHFISLPHYQLNYSEELPSSPEVC